MLTFSFVGIWTAIWFAFSFLKLLVALFSSSDFETAKIRKLPSDAFDNKVVWITGASSGIGREMALLLAKRNAILILSSRRKEALEEVAAECRESNAKARIEILTLDLQSDLDILATKANEAISKFGKIDVLINNGGVSTRVLARDCTHHVDQYLAQVDYLAHVAITKALLPTLEGQSEARVVNIGSPASKMGIPVRTAYCGAKHALLGFMDALRVETNLTGHSHVHILNICLGSTATPLPGNAVVGVDSKTGQVQTFQQPDDNISNGMDPTRVAERILAASHAKTLNEVWLAKGKELLIFYLNQYMPATAFRLLVKAVGKQYAVGGDPDKKVNSKAKDE